MTRVLVSAGGHEVVVSKKSYLELVRTLADNVQKVPRNSSGINHKVAASERKIKDIELKVHPRTDKLVMVPDLER